MNPQTIKRSLAEIITERKAAQLALQTELLISQAGEAPAKPGLVADLPYPTSLSSSPSPILPPKKQSLSELLYSRKSQTLTDKFVTDKTPISQRLMAKQIGELNKEEESSTIEEDSAQKETFSLSIILNKDQQMAKELAFSGKSFCLIGAAGTGKTTAQREIASELLRQNKLGTHSFKVAGSPGQREDGPSIAFVAYTRIATGNLRRAIHKDPSLEEVLIHNILTIHSLLEYEPETYWDYEENKEKFHFFPRRTASNPLDITHLVIEESSTVGLDLWEKLFAALRNGVQIIFIGDINQLPPVFGPSVLNYALVQLPIVELTHVYRQKGDSSILENAHRILSGNKDLKEDENFKIIRGGTVQYTQSKLALGLSASLKKWKEVGEYDPEQDIILSPFNKQDLGTDMLNKYISQFLGEERGAIVYEIICGINKVYLAVGDKVFFNKQIGFVKEIRRNSQYYGKAPKSHSIHLTRHGTYNGVIEDQDDDAMFAGYENISLEEIAKNAEESEAKRSASHIVILEMETGIEEELTQVGQFAPQVFSLGYALTIHKAQGCEWRKVIIVLHRDHSIMAFRELLYTAVTRSRENCILITKDTMIEKAIKSQRIKGNTLAEKIAFFNAGLMSQENVPCIK